MPNPAVRSSHNGEERDCMTSEVDYLVSRNQCGEQYIGETGIRLCQGHGGSRPPWECSVP